MPLYADWRHPKPRVARLAQGGVVRTSTTTIAAPFFFCSYNLSIERTLRTLHERQRVHGDVQHEIDVHIVACISPETAHLRLPRHSVPHYDNLPDISAYALGILDPAMDSDQELQQVLLLLRQCTPLRRRTKRAQREVQWREDSCFPMQTLVRCMQGTLLGLYPNCVKAIAFSARVTLYRFLRTLLVQPFAKLHAALNRLPYITKLSVMEHLCNTIYDYHPGICHTLNRSGQKVEHFCDSVANICGIFRTELNTLFCAELPSDGAVPSAQEMERILFRILPQLERTSHSFYERSTRAYRGIIIGSAPPPRCIDLARKLLPRMTVPLATLMEDVHATGTNATLFDLAHQARLPDANARQMAWYVTQLLQAHPLPLCVARQQLAALHRRYGDSVRMRHCRMLHVCLHCIVKKGTATGIRLRHDCVTDSLACMVCGPGTVVALDMVGRLVQIGNEFLLLSSCCGTFIFYEGSGFEFVCQCGVQCAPKQQLFRKRERIVAPTPRTLSPACLVCGARSGIAQTLPLLVPERREVTLRALCAKHMVPQHIAAHAYTADDLHRFFHLRATTAATPRAARGSGE
jgi:hypothetical protein